MLAISYLHSPNILSSLKQIDASRQAILLAPLQPQKELALRWDATINSVQCSLRLSQLDLKKEAISALLSTKTKKIQPPAERAAIAYKKGIDYIAQYWIANPETVATKTIAHLQAISYEDSTTEANADIQMILDYLQVKPDHAVIQAAIAFHFLTQREAVLSQNITARLLSRLFLYKYGYDCKGFISPEQHWAETQATLHELVRNSAISGNITGFIEYFVQGIEGHLAVTADKVLNSTEQVTESHFAHLNERQKQMVIFLDNPNTSLSNAMVQRMHRVSQITASRDLAKLNALGLVIPHGKGRSVYYTKV